MKNEFVPYDIALAMKELGFDEPCVGTYHDNGKKGAFTFGMFQYSKKNSQANTVEGTFIGKEGCYAPLYQQAFRWFREEFGIMICHQEAEYFTSFTRIKPKMEVLSNVTDKHCENHFEEAQDACLRRLIEIVKEKRDEK